MDFLLRNLNAIGDFLMRMPQGAWTFMAGILAITGVLLTIKDQGRRLALQFKNDRRLKDRDREMQTRKDIFLNAVEAFQSGLISLAQYADRDKAIKDVLELFQKNAPAIAKIYVVASQSTIGCVAEVMAGITFAQLKLSFKKAELDKLVSEINITDYLIARDEKERDHVMELNKMNHFNLENDIEKRERLNLMFNFHRENIDKLLEQKVKQDMSATTLQIELFREARELERSIWPSLISTVAAFRTELELPADVFYLQDLADKSFAKLEPLFTEIFDRAK